MGQLPSGTTTFLFTDIEGSTRLWETVPEKMQVALRRHHAILQCAIESNSGVVFQIVGDAFCAAFHTAPSAVFAAIKAQQELYAANWDLPNPIRVRMGIHTGLAEPVTGESATGGYTSNQTLNRAARIMSAGHGGQILLSLATEELARDALPEISKLQDLGEHRLRDVIHPEHLFQLNISGLPCDFPTPKTLNLRRNNLPIQLTEFIGRDKELGEIDKALTQNRLVTVIGSGGTGKTRLAIEAGAAQIISSQIDNRFPYGVYFVALAPLQRAEEIVPAIAAALGFSFYEGGEPHRQLLDYLHEKSLLLILDNFEHLLHGADLVTEILNSAPNVKIIATSRVRLNMEGEQLFHLTGMPFPTWEVPQDAAEYSAVKLFLQTARRVRPNFELTTENMKFVVRLCRLVEGIPLGILLAASWMELLSPEEIANEIEKNLDFLESTQRDLPARQQSMRAVFDYSWKLLTPGEQSTFMKASVFRGGFTREAVQQVARASLRDLIGLVDKSLLQRDSSGRYQIHELLRQYGAEKLTSFPNDLEKTRDQHSKYFAEYLQQRESALLGKGQKQALRDIKDEIENVRASWSWSVSQARMETIHCCVATLAEFYFLSSLYREGAESLQQALQAVERKDPHLKNADICLLRAKLMSRYGRFCETLGAAKKGREVLLDSLAICNKLKSHRETAIALYYLGQVTSMISVEESFQFYQQGLSIFREIGDRWGITVATEGLAWAILRQGNHEEAKQKFIESLELQKALGSYLGVISSLGSLGYTCWILGEYAEAKQLHNDALEMCKEMGDQHGIARNLDLLAIDSVGLKEYEEAKRLALESLTIAREVGEAWRCADILSDLGEMAILQNEYVKAIDYASQSLAQFKTIGESYGSSWSLRVLGNAACGLGNLKDARTYFFQALKLTMESGVKSHLLHTMVGIAKLLDSQGEQRKALEILSLVVAHKSSWQMIKDLAVPMITELETKLPANVAAQAEQDGRARDLDATVAELLDELKE